MRRHAGDYIPVHGITLPAQSVARSSVGLERGVFLKPSRSCRKGRANMGTFERTATAINHQISWTRQTVRPFFHLTRPGSDERSREMKRQNVPPCESVRKPT